MHTLLNILLNVQRIFTTKFSFSFLSIISLVLLLYWLFLTNSVFAFEPSSNQTSVRQGTPDNNTSDISSNAKQLSVKLSQPLNQRLITKSYSILDGLSQASVFDIVQDDEGFIWLATQDGLNRFDGTEFNHFRHNTEDKHSLAVNFIR